MAVAILAIPSAFLTKNVHSLMDDHLAVVGLEESSLFGGRKSKNRSEA
jgi:hypothetical protein